MTETRLNSTQLDFTPFKTFATVADMVASTVLNIGDRVKTLGYFAIGDGGDNEYDVVAASTGTADGGSYINLAAHQAKGLFPSNIYSVNQWGATGDGVTDDTAAIQAALDSLGTTNTLSVDGGRVHIPAGDYVTSQPLKFKSGWTSLVGSGEGNTRIVFSGTSGQAAITTDTVSSIYSYIRVSDLTVRVVNANTNGIDFTYCQNGAFENMSITLLADNSVGIYGQGNNVGSAPYYNHFNNIVIAGSWTPSVPTTDTVGFRFKHGNESLSDSPNGNLITNIKRIASVNKAFDIQSGNGNMFSNIGAESIGDSVFEFGNISATYTGTATSGTANSITDTGGSFGVLSNGTLVVTGGTGNGLVAKIDSSTSTSATLTQSQSVVLDNTTTYSLYKNRASSNKVVNLRHEGTNTAAAIKNNYGAANNSISGVFTTGATVYWQNLCRDGGTIINKSGLALNSVTFYAENLAASSTITLSPIGGGGLSIAGGIRNIHPGFEIAGIGVAVNNMGAGALGSATVKIVVNGSEVSDLETTINANNRFGFSKIASTAQGVKMVDRNFYVKVDTDGSWDATAADISVTVYYTS